MLAEYKKAYFYRISTTLFYMYVSFFTRKSDKFRSFSMAQYFDKNTYCWNQIVQNHYIHQSMAKFPLQTPKIANFSLKTLHFSNFWRLRRRKFGVLCPKNSEFFGEGVPPGRGPPKNTLKKILIFLTITRILNKYSLKMK